MTPDSLRQEWNDMMLAGRFGWMDNGQVMKMEPDNSHSDPSASSPDVGWLPGAPVTIGGIAVLDLR